MEKYLFIDGFNKEYHDTLVVLYDTTTEKTPLKPRKDIKAYKINTKRKYFMLTAKSAYDISDGKITKHSFHK